jgi:hypothetical protein
VLGREAGKRQLSKTGCEVDTDDTGVADGRGMQHHENVVSLPGGNGVRPTGLWLAHPPSSAQLGLPCTCE